MEKNNQPKHKIVQTYAEDMAGVLEDSKGGLIKKIIHGEEEFEEQKKNLSPESKKNKFFMFLGATLFLVSVGTLTFLLINRSVAPSVPVEQQFVPLIFTDKSTFVEINELKKEEIAEKFLTQVNATTVKNGRIEAIYPTLNKVPVGLRKFLLSIDANFTPTPGDFLEDNFMMGVYKDANPDLSTNDFFILMKMRAIPDVFNSMHSWENKMFTDLHGFFGVPFSPETKYLLTKNFENGIIQNKNARILYDNGNKIVLMYVFIDDHSIIITNTENAAREIMHRLASSEVKK